MLDYLRLRRPAAISKPIRYLIAFVSLAFLATLYLFYRSSEGAHVLAPAPVPADGVDRVAGEPPIEPVTVKPIATPIIVPVDVRLDPAVDATTGRANATILMLARNSDIEGVEKSMRSLESRFNLGHGYPWTFLNEVPFDDEFKNRVATLTNSEVRFGLVPHDHWFQPDWIDEELVQKGKEELMNLETPWPIPYANSTPYRNMCRFNSGFFFRHELLNQYKWYWRVEPDVDFTCNINFDPFAYMIENNKRYSFTISLKEVKPTIPSLWNTIKNFRKTYPDIIAEDNAPSFISDDDGATYNDCHFWSNFEIADLDFFRSAEYLTYFDFLDATGNFYYERWGDAPVHSIAAALFLPRSQVHFFNEIGYHHAPYQHCPQGPLHSAGECSCNLFENYDFNRGSCLSRFLRLFPAGHAG